MSVTQAIRELERKGRIIPALPSSPALPGLLSDTLCHVDKDDIKFLTPLPKDWDYRCVPLYLVCAVLRINPRASGMLGTDSAN